MTKKPEKTVLAIDTALGGISVGVVATNGHIVTRMIETAREQASLLIPMIQEVVSEAELTLQDVDLIVTSKGPGSFTGLRIGLSTARTMALALGIPVVGVNTLDVMAAHYETDGNLLIVLETKRQDFYARYYDADKTPLNDASACDAQMVLDGAPEGVFEVGGDCLERFQGCVSEDLSALSEWKQPDPVLMVQFGLKQFEEHGDEGAPQPLYLRGADVSMPKNAPRKLQQLN